jgi:hypothetical protein
MTISGPDNQGTPIVPTTWSGASSQLWTATQVIGKLWTFVSLGGNALRASSFQVGAPLVLGPHDPSNNDADEYWVFPND